MKSKQVWIIDEGSQGHVVQSRGLVREMKKLIPVEVHEFSARLTSRSSLVRSIVRKIFRRRPVDWLFWYTHSVSEIPSQLPDLIISSGPRSLTALLYFSRMHHCPSVFVQGTLNVPRNTVDVIMRPDDGVPRDDTIFIPLIFTEITQEDIERTKLDYVKNREVGGEFLGLRVIFVGASSSKIVFEDSDWDRLAGLINRSFEADGRKWLVTTSYRTGAAVEKRLRELINPAAVYDAVWYSSAARKVTKAFLGMADEVYVTMDSMTMVSEALSSGLPVTVIRPLGLRTGNLNPHVHYINDLARQGFLTISTMSEENFLTSQPHLKSMDYTPSIRKLLAKIGWA